MIYQNILVPFDNSEPAFRALLEAVRFAQEDDAVTLRIVNIIDTQKLAEEKLAEQDPEKETPRYSRKDIDSLYKAVVSEADALLHLHIDEALVGLSNEIVIEMLEETVPGEQILTYAKQHGSDVIIMGSKGFGTIRGILGSVSSHVLRSSEIPVLIVK